MNDEEWRDVPGAEGDYQVSNLGRVKRLFDTPWMRSGIVKPYRQNGYPRVYLGWNGYHYDQEYVHRLVAIAFLGEPPEDKPQVNHINGNRADNQLCNLEWCSPAYNTKDARRREYLELASIGPGGGIRIFDKWSRE